jgi:hypothetical protein
MQQRGVPPLIVEWLSDYDACRHDRRGAELRYFDKRARKFLAREVGAAVLDRMSSYLSTYLVTDGAGTVITVGYRTRRLRS